MGGLPKRAGLFFCSLPVWPVASGVVPADLPLRSIPPRLTARCLPLTAAGGQGPSRQHRLRPCISTTSFTPPLSKAARTASRLRPRVARALQDNSACDHAHPLHPPLLTARCPSRQRNRISLGLSRWPPVLKPWLSGRSMSVRAAPLRIRSFSSGRYFW